MSSETSGTHTRSVPTNYHLPLRVSRRVASPLPRTFDINAAYKRRTATGLRTTRKETANAC